MSDLLTIKLVDGYALNSADGYSFTTPWISVHNYRSLSAIVVFTGGAPVGTLTLDQCNDTTWTGLNAVEPLSAAGADNSSGAIKKVTSTIQVPSGTGINSSAVNGNGAYVLNQIWLPYRWLRVVYTASVNANTQLDIFVHAK